MEGGPMAEKRPGDTKADGSAGGVLARARAKVPLSREPRTLREEQQRATRQKLIAATFSAFSEKGFHDTTIADIVKAAGTSRATFYLHFASKSEALAAAWAEMEQPSMIAHWRRLDGFGPWTAADILGWVSDMVGAWEATRAFSIASNQAVSTDAEMSRRWFGGIADFLGHVPNVILRLGRDTRDPDLRFLLLCAQMERSTFMFLTGNFPGNREQFVATLAEFWRDALVDDEH
ncbi:MAG: hypothetical protein DI556_21445 [Rhodovulum sulfidophilum]|uniref:HTH tetR-type domain-containing protein n=1 Tax=Rhodovulum sulfidophilum TaxID=35806 RepID=A0A2W5N5L8_RHOSU|nr:MAG: hypothetical protein DI556_21445 [Rhodovulum sulfidophilum]